MSPLTVAVGLLLGCVVVFVSMTSGAGLMYLALKFRAMGRALAAIEAKIVAPAPAARQILDDIRLDHRAQLLSVAALVKLAARDNLDALYRVSPNLVEEVLTELKLKH